MKVKGIREIKEEGQLLNKDEYGMHSGHELRKSEMPN